MTPSDAIASDAVERRLHPWSWLFVLLQQLKQFIVPLLALLFFGQGSSNDNGSNELWPLIGVGVLVVVSVLQYFTYRYAIGRDAITIRSGWLQRSRREIPFARIHNVGLQQSVLHRVFGVAEVRLESAGGAKPEAEMRVLKLEDALALEALVRRRGQVASGEAVRAEGEVLLQLPPGEIVRLGLISNRGLLLVGGALAATSQVSPRLLGNLVEGWAEQAMGWASNNGAHWSNYALAGASLVLLAIAVLRLLSVLLALLQYYGFTLSEHGRRLTVERGLLARWRNAAARRRIQAWTLSEGWLHRRFRRRSLSVDTAGAPEQNRQRSLHDLAPIATPETCDALVERLLPASGWSTTGSGGLDWQPLHPRAWRRLCLPGVVFALLATAILAWRFGAWSLLALLWIPWSWHAARQHARRAGYALNARLVAVRGGWFQRFWRFAEIDKLQALRLSQSPFDRRHGMATLWLDTAGAGAMAPPLRIRFIDAARARALHAQLSATLARRALK
jgi:putative membrane protein